ncbi:MAG: branched-chain amino acid ABC transporter permease [Chloroflexota bacterium]|nr:branched-chain amino acid ABC transporter permease [Chloroflexota bacterium]
MRWGRWRVTPFSVAELAAAHRRRRGVQAILLLAVIAFPLLSSDTFLIDRVGRYFLFAAFAVSVDLIWGYGGMFTFGHAAFFGGGGYIVGVLTTQHVAFLPVPLWAALIGAVLGAGLFALALSYFVFSGRGALRGVEFAVVTLAVAVVAERFTNAGGSVTGGQNGILMSSSLDIPGVISLQQGYGFYALAGLLLMTTYVGVQRFLSSRSGLILRGIRENEDRIDLLGYDVPAIKRRAFVLSAAIAALAGGIFYVHEGIVSPGAVGVGASTLVLLWVVLGGRGTLIGPMVGAILLPYLTATLSGSLLDTWLVVVGVILVAVILVLPSGIFGFLNPERGT